MTVSTKVVITRVDTKAAVTFALQGDSSYARDSQGGWQLVDRPRREVSTEWLDYGPMELTLPLMINGMTGAGVWGNIEPTITAVEGWEKPVGVEPPKLRIAGPVPHTDLTWVCKSLSWAAAFRSPTTGFRAQQTLSLVLLEYVPPTVAVVSTSPAKAAQQRQATSTAAAPAVRAYTVKAGDTLDAISIRYFGSISKVATIAALNGIRDPNFIHTGQVLKLPAA